MKTIKISLLVMLLIACFVSGASARLHETREQLIERYGEPILDGKLKGPDYWKDGKNYSFHYMEYKNPKNIFIHEYDWKLLLTVEPFFGDPANWEHLEFRMPVDGEEFPLKIQTGLHKGVCLFIYYSSLDRNLADTIVTNNGYSLNKKITLTKQEKKGIPGDFIIRENINNKDYNVAVWYDKEQGAVSLVSKKWFELRDEWVKEVEAQRKARAEQVEREKKEQEAKRSKTLMDKL